MNAPAARLERLLPRSLTDRVFVVYAVLLVVFLGGGLGLFLRHQFRHQVENTQQASVMLVEVVAQAVQDSVVIGDYDTVRKTLHKSVQDSVFRSAGFIERGGGRIQAESSAIPLGHPPEALVRWVEERLFDVNRTITVGGKDYGVLRLRFDSAGVAADLWQLSVMAIGLALLSLVIGLTLIRLLVARWLGALVRLPDFEAALAQNRAPEPAPIDPKAPTEIRQVVELFNRTAELVREREASRLALDNQKFALDQHAIVSITNRHGDITYANDRFCQISGYRREELLGQNHRVIGSGTHPPDFFETLWARIAAGEVWRGEICNRARDGSLYWVDATIVPLRGADGRPEQYIAIRTDITYRKAMESSLQSAKEVAERSDRAKSDFLANMSHELRTPLNAILGMLSLLQKTDLNRRQSDYAVKTEGAARSLLALLNDILDFSKVEAGMMQLDPRPFRLDRLLRDLSVVLSASAGDKKLEILFDVDPMLPRSLVGDDLRLQQVLINLGGNAIKFTDDGEVRLSVRLLEHTAREARIRFEICDTGIGIPAEAQARIFEGFSQAESSTTRRFGGTGLGLAICQRLLSLMGSRIELESQEGKGSRFGFELRLPIAEQLPADHQAARQDPSLQGLRVLVVDDNPSAREVHAGMASSLGWQVDTAVDGEQAIAMTEAAVGVDRPYDAIFVDWQMPGLDGWETSMRLRRIAGTPETSVVMMVTAHGRELLESRDATEVSMLGGFLVKPITASMLFDAVASARGASTGEVSPSARKRRRSARLNGLRLLLVEDNPNNQQVAQELLELEGANVTVASNGEFGVEAVAKAKEPFDAVLMDLQMPVMDGFAATSLIRSKLGMTHLPIIAMTANAMASDREACLAAGMNDHVGKPFELASLAATLLRHTRAPDPVESPDADNADGEWAQPQALPEALLERAQAEGVALRAALARFEGETEVYLGMLRSFIADVPGLVDQFETHLGAGEMREAARLMHTYKGLAGMMGAQSLAALCAELDQALRTSRKLPPDGVARLRSSVETTHDTMQMIATELQGLRQAPTPASVSGSAADPATVRGLLSELAGLLASSDMKALELHEALSRQLPALTRSKLKDALDDAMATLDFDAARGLCEQLQRELA